MYQSIEYEIDLHLTAYEKLFFKRESCQRHAGERGGSIG